VSRTLGADALWTACGDFNNDGRIDVSVGNNGGANSFTTFYTQADGSLPLIGATTATGGSPTSRLCAGDFNADGCADLIYQYDNSGMKLTYGQPNSAFAGTTTIGPPNGNALWGKTAVGDVNHDGRLDALIGYAESTSGAGGVGVAYALAGGGFNASIVQTNSNPNGIATADLNRDGHLDIIVGDNSPASPIKVAYGSASGALTSA
jgi:hypothetical protein